MSVNKVILIGRLGNQPELRYTTSNRAVTELRLATDHKWSDKEGQLQEKTEWHTVVVWGRDAENCERYLRKGRQVYVEGRLETRSWEDQAGTKRYKTEVVANLVRFLGSRDDEGGGRASDDGGGSRGDRGGNRDTGRQPASPASEAPAPGMSDDAIEEDIPF